MKNIPPEVGDCVDIDTLPVNVDVGQAWTDKFVGKLWWDLRTAKFLETGFEDLEYKNNNWNVLAPGASIDIYEWVSYNQLPANWDALADTPLGIAQGISGTSLYGNTSYSIKQTYNTVTQSFKNTYYFWVRNISTVNTVVGKKLSTTAINDVAEAERALAEAKSKAAKFSKAAHLAALAAATKAQAETAALIEAAKEAEQLANYHAGQTDTQQQ